MFVQRFVAVNLFGLSFMACSVVLKIVLNSITEIEMRDNSDNL